jgi:hypothetical protein
MTAWTELGIAPTKDAKAIRRAYAARLRTLDPDKEPAAFQRLRQAYEQALHAEAEEHPLDGLTLVRVTPDGEPVSPAAHEPAQAVPAVEQTAEEQERQQLWAAIRAALQANDSLGALRCLTGELATGVVHLGEHDDILEELMPTIVNDQTLSPADYIAVIEQCGWNLSTSHYGLTTARRAALDRYEAERWYLACQRWAKSRPHMPFNVDDPLAALGIRSRDKRRKKAAMLLLQGKSFICWGRGSAAATVRFWDELVHHRPWIEHRFDPANIRRLASLAEYERTNGSIMRTRLKMLLWFGSIGTVEWLTLSGVISSAVNLAIVVLLLATRAALWAITTGIEEHSQ